MNHPPNHHFDGWYKPSNMGWFIIVLHCLTHMKHNLISMSELSPTHILKEWSEKNKCHQAPLNPVDRRRSLQFELLRRKNRLRQWHHGSTHGDSVSMIGDEGNNAEPKADKMRFDLGYIICSFTRYKHMEYGYLDGLGNRKAGGILELVSDQYRTEGLLHQYTHWIIDRFGGYVDRPMNTWNTSCHDFCVPMACHKQKKLTSERLSMTSGPVWLSDVKHSNHKNYQEPIWYGPPPAKLLTFIWWSHPFRKNLWRVENSNPGGSVVDLAKVDSSWQLSLPWWLFSNPLPSSFCRRFHMPPNSQHHKKGSPKKMESKPFLNHHPESSEYIVLSKWLLTP